MFGLPIANVLLCVYYASVPLKRPVMVKNVLILELLSKEDAITSALEGDPTVICNITGYVSRLNICTYFSFY